MSNICGKTLSQTIREELKHQTQELQQQGIHPCLAVILVGNDPASEVYVRNKKKACADLGMRSKSYELPESTSEAELLKLIEALNDNSDVHGILCQFPVPAHISQNNVIETIAPYKDVDGLHPQNAGLLASGRPHFVPCTPLGVLEMLKRHEIETSGKQVVVLGRSNLVGRPIATLLSQKGWDATVTVCHSRTKDLETWCQNADILVAAIGKPEFVTGAMVKEGAVVIDVGINRVDDPNTSKGYRLCGDVLYDEVAPKASWITPVPGGVGPMTITMLLSNTLRAAQTCQKDVKI